MNKKYFGTVAVLTTFLLSLVGCGGGGMVADKATTPEPGAFRDIPASTAEVAKIQRGTKLAVLVDRETGKRWIPIVAGNAINTDGIRYVAFTDDARQFGPGDSGSPVVNEVGNTVGAISGSFGGDNVLFTPIDAMIESANKVNSTVSAADPAQRKNQLSWFAMGIDRAGSEKLSTKLGVKFTSVGAGSREAMVTTAGPGKHEIEAGKSIAIILFQGPLVSFYGIGTATHQVDKSRLVGFGHPMDWAGKLQNPYPVTAARVVQFVNDPTFGSFKLGVPVGDVQAGLVNDRLAAVTIDRNAAPTMIGLRVRVGGRSTLHKVMLHDDQGFSWFLGEIGVSYIAQDMVDKLRVGTFGTRVYAHRTDGTVGDHRFGAVNWDGEGYWNMWSTLSMAEDLNSVKEFEFILSDL